MNRQVINPVAIEGTTLHQCGISYSQQPVEGGLGDESRLNVSQLPI